MGSTASDSGAVLGVSTVSGALLASTGIDLFTIMGLALGLILLVAGLTLLKNKKEKDEESVV